MNFTAFVYALTKEEMRELAKVVASRYQQLELAANATLTPKEKETVATDKIQTIRDVRARLSCDVRTAKDIVDRYLEEEQIKRLTKQTGE